MVRKWLNIAASNADYSADSDSGSDSEQGPFCQFTSFLLSFWPFSSLHFFLSPSPTEFCDRPKESRFKNEKITDELKFDANGFCDWPKESRLKNEKSDKLKFDANGKW